MREMAERGGKWLQSIIFPCNLVEFEAYVHMCDVINIILGAVF
jgi:hypothetical protein